MKQNFVSIQFHSYLQAHITKGVFQCCVTSTSSTVSLSILVAAWRLDFQAHFVCFWRAYKFAWIYLGCQENICVAFCDPKVSCVAQRTSSLQYLHCMQLVEKCNTLCKWNDAFYVLVKCYTNSLTCAGSALISVKDLSQQALTKPNHCTKCLKHHPYCLESWCKLLHTLYLQWAI